MPSKNIHLKPPTYFIAFFNPRLSVQIKELIKVGLNSSIHFNPCLLLHPKSTKILL